MAPEKMEASKSFDLSQLLPSILFDDLTIFVMAMQQGPFFGSFNWYLRRLSEDL